MNVKANKLIAELEDVEYFDVFPSCGDESLPFGALWSYAAARGSSMRAIQVAGFSSSVRVGRSSGASQTLFSVAMPACFSTASENCLPRTYWRRRGSVMHRRAATAWSPSLPTALASR